MPSALWFWAIPPYTARWDSEVDAEMIARSFDEREELDRDDIQYLDEIAREETK
jgi:hypothetical protein